MKKMDKETLLKTLENHRLWLESKGGEKADLEGADLEGADLRSADLGRTSAGGLSP
jgi:uncharacterized protein YjbI with pentapeptide repeats